nr:hypothetical protein 10 [Bacillaceae bacterium]
MELQDVKSYLKITWSEEDIDLIQFIESGKAYLNGKAGTDLDYLNDYTVTQLLKDYCRYAYNHSLELFDINFKRDLLNLSLREAVKLREANSSDV